MWFVLFLIWVYIIVFNDNVSTISWWFLFLLWIGVVVHYAIAYRKWNKEMKLRRQERREKVEADRKRAQEQLEGPYVSTETRD